MVALALLASVLVVPLVAAPADARDRTGTGSIGSSAAGGSLTGDGTGRGGPIPPTATPDPTSTPDSNAPLDASASPDTGLPPDTGVSPASAASDGPAPIVTTEPGVVADGSFPPVEGPAVVSSSVVDGAPRQIGLGPASPSRAVSAPATDPLSLIERDGGLSVKLSDGKQLWLFADTAVVVNGTMTYFSSRGSGAISVGSDPYTITEPSVPHGYIRHPATPLISGGTISCPAGYDDAYWPGSAVAVPQAGGGDVVYVYYQSLCGRGADQGSYYSVSTGLARYDYHPSRPPSLTFPIRATVVVSSLFGPLPGHSGPGAGYGVTSMLSGGMIYAYGCSYSPVWQSCRVVRVAPSSAAIASSYRYWNGTNWVASAGSAVDLDMPDALIGIKGSVSYIASVGLYAFADNDFPGPRIAVRWAHRPEGPWSAPSFVSLPDCSGPDCWAAEVHGSLSSGTSLALTYYASSQRPGMRTVQVPLLVGPTGVLDPLASEAPDQVSVSGWAVDPDTTDPIDVHLYVDGAFHAAAVASGSRSGAGAGRGFRWTLDHLAEVPHTMCVYGINVGLGSSNDLIGCRSMRVATALSPVSATDATGRMIVLAPNALGELLRRTQTTPGGAWGPWVPTGAAPRSAPVVARNQDGRLEVFVADHAGGLIHQWERAPGGEWSSWRWTGVFVVGRPAIGIAPDGRLELFVRDPRGGLIHQWQVTANGAWGNWQFEGVFVREDPSVASSSDGRLELFAVDLRGGLIQRWQLVPNGGWATWAFTGMWVRGAVALAAAPDGRLELFGTDAGGGLIHRWQVTPNGSWSAWFSRGVPMSGSPLVVTNADGRLQLFVTSPAGALLTASQVAPNGHWSAWSALGMQTRLAPAATVVATKVVVVVVGTDGRLRTATQTATAWSSWTAL